MPDTVAIILFQCSRCGHPQATAAENTCGTVTCSHCGDDTPVPKESDPEIRFVYRRGGETPGTPMLLSDIPALLLGGTLASSDLIWEGGRWQPLVDVFGDVEHLDAAGAPAASDLGEPALEHVVGPLDPLVFTREDHPLADTLSRSRRIARRRLKLRLTRLLKVLLAILFFLFSAWLFLLWKK